MGARFPGDFGSQTVISSCLVDVFLHENVQLSVVEMNNRTLGIYLRRSIWVFCLGLASPQALAAAPETTGVDWVAFLGPFHVVALHYPIGFLTLAVLFEAWAFRFPLHIPRRVIRWTLCLATAAAWLASGLGLLRASRGEFQAELLSDHRFFGLSVAALSATACFLHCKVQGTTGKFWSWGYRSVLLLCFICLVTAGHQGGSLTHGSSFLTENAPAFLGGSRKVPSAGSISARDPSMDLYSSVIQPTLSRKCYSCHGSEKQKGKLRLDTPEGWLKGGKSGEPSVVPGDVSRSRLVKVLLLPRSDDDAMPPSGKEPMTETETLAVIRWVQSAANVDSPSSR